jgi:hypothetical protein
MRSMIAGAAILVAALAGCGERASPVANLGEAAETGNAQIQIAEMPEGQRNAVFIRAIRDANEECQNVERSERSGEYEGRPVWTAHCLGGGEYTIVIGEDGMAGVLDARESELADGNQAANEGQ